MNKSPYRNVIRRDTIEVSFMLIVLKIESGNVSLL